MQKAAETPCKNWAIRDPPRTATGPVPDRFHTNKPATGAAPATTNPEGRLGQKVDTNVVLEAIFWQRSTSRRAPAALALLRFKTAASQEILGEYATITGEIRGRLFPQALRSGQ
jgi:hypothetical protein